MKHQILIAAGLAVAATGIATTPVSAGPFDKLKKAVKKVEKAAEDASTAVEVVEETRDNLAAREEEAAKLREALSRLAEVA